MPKEINTCVLKREREIDNRIQRISRFMKHYPGYANDQIIFYVSPSIKCFKAGRRLLSEMVKKKSFQGVRRAV